MTETTSPARRPVITFTVGGHEFVLRRPTRADEAQIWRTYAMKIGLACPSIADAAGAESARATIEGLDGANLYAEARFEVLLAPRLGASDLGEHAPVHWIRELKDADGKAIGKVIAFDEVDPDEFAEAARLVDQALAPSPQLATQPPDGRLASSEV